MKSKKVVSYGRTCIHPHLFLEDSTKRISLTSVPMSGNWLLGPSDIDELLFMLQDTPVNEMENRIEANQAFMARYRPSRIRSMFASRACRKAVMVGDSLTPIQMKNLIHHLGELQQPWVIISLFISLNATMFLFCCCCLFCSFLLELPSWTTNYEAFNQLGWSSMK